MVAGLAFLLPSAIMAGYLILNSQIAMSIASLELYFEYIFGIYVGSLIIRKIKVSTDIVMKRTDIIINREKSV